MGEGFREKALGYLSTGTVEVSIKSGQTVIKILYSGEQYRAVLDLD